MSVTTVVVAHEKRRKHLAELVMSVCADEVFVDDGMLGEWANHERALRLAHDVAATVGDSHVVIVQDDAIPVPDFWEQCARAIWFRPDDMIGLYVGTHRPCREAVDEAVRVADETNAMWLSYHELNWGVATIIPTRYIPAMLEWCAKSNKPYDLRLGRAWAAVRGEGKPVLYTWPSLVDHRDEKTVIASRDQPQGVRVARRVGPLLGDPTLVVPIVTSSARSRERRASRKKTVT